METLRKMGPFQTLVLMADVFAGYGIISYYYMYGNLTRNSGIFFLLLISGLIFSARNMWHSFLNEAEYKDENNFRKDTHDTSTFIRGCLFCLLGLVVAMSRGMVTFMITALLVALIIFKVFLLRKNDFFSAIFEGFVRGTNVILGMSIYPLLEVTFWQPVPLIIAGIIGIYTCAVLLAVQANLNFPSRLNLFFSVAAAICTVIGGYYIMPHGLATKVIIVFALVIIALTGFKSIFSRHDKSGLIFSRYGLSALIIFEMAWIASYSRGWEYQTRIISMGPLAFLFLVSLIMAFYYARKPAVYSS